MSEANTQPPEPVSADDEISLLDLVLVLAENLSILILIPLAAGLLALGNAYLTTPTFTATTRILPPIQQQSASSSLLSQFGALAGVAGKSPVDQYLAFLKSGPVLDGVIGRFKLKELWQAKYTVDARKTLESITKVSVGAKDGIISIEVDDQDPKRAADIANAYVEELRSLLKTLAVTEASQRRLFFEAQLTQAKDNLTKSEIALRGSGISEAALKTMPQSALEALARTRAQITAQEIKIASMRTSMTDSNPDLRLALQELAALRSGLSKLEQSNTTKEGGEGAEYIAKFRDFKYHETLFDLMAKQYEVARLDEARDGAVIQVLEAAQPPERKSKPEKAKSAVVTTLAVFFMMIIFVFIRQALSSMTRDDETAQKLRRLRRLLLLRNV
jgi:uncharacterized protein involved in exopolysaccharide biosynthesis